MLGVCYYPEQWPRKRWPQDIARMAELGLSRVRLGDFAWNRLEPQTDQWDGEWLDGILELLTQHGLQAVLATPTAGPPKWLVDRYPEILPLDAQGRIRRFGSQRHSCFSSPAWRQQSERIVTLLAQRYGQHPAVVGWQTDNSFGLHNTVRCYCPRCKQAFRTWLEGKYGGVEALNEAWGNPVWSQAFRSFEEIDLPFLTVARPNPSHLLDYYRFASDQVLSYQRMQANLLREMSPGRFITHNFPGCSTDLNHFALGEELDFSSWNSFPLSLTARLPLSPEERLLWARSGHPDLAAWHHDLHRRVGRGRWWVMEQQPGPVCWADYNPAPAPGMVRLWSWEALAHGAECVSYYRWQETCHAQEQLCAGLLRPDGTPDRGYAEVAQVVQELSQLSLEPVEPASVALIYDYEAAWISEIAPHGVSWDYAELVGVFYSTLRSLGLDVDVKAPTDVLDGYSLVVAPSLPALSPELLESLRTLPCVVLGPRSGSKTPSLGTAQNNPFRVRRVESLPPALTESLRWQGRDYSVHRWREEAEGEGTALAHFGDGTGALWARDGLYYLAFWPDRAFLQDWFDGLCQELGLETLRPVRGLRLRRRGSLTFCFNYGAQAQQAPAPPGACYVLGGPWVGAHSVCAWR